MSVSISNAWITRQLSRDLIPPSVSPRRVRIARAAVEAVERRVHLCVGYTADGHCCTDPTMTRADPAMSTADACAPSSARVAPARVASRLFTPAPVTPAGPMPTMLEPPRRVDPRTGVDRIGLGLHWSDRNTWDRRMPTATSDVVIPAGKTVVLDTNVVVKSLTVHGTLIVEDARDLTLSADWIMVHDGRLQAGTEAVPHTHKFTITLEGDDRTLDIPQHGVVDNNAFLMVMGTGKLELHGEDRNGWTKLKATAARGATSVSLLDTAGWRVGDRIVIASTDFDMNQAEQRTITGVSHIFKTVTFAQPLNHMHFGQVQNYSRPATTAPDGTQYAARTWTLDERAEVGLLSRNIKIQGDADSVTDGFGGHVMGMRGSTMRVEGVEFDRMGQRSIVARYPFHWHMMGDASGQYIKDSSLHHTFNRAITVHGTQNALVEGNVAYDTLGHTYFLEDGSETGNRLIDNLGLVTRRMSTAQATIPTDNTHPSTFWIENPDNTLIGNVAAGSDHGGFWYALSPRPHGFSATSYAHLRPKHTPFGTFAGNVGHSARFSNFAIDGSVHPTTLAFVESHYSPRANPQNPGGSAHVMPVITDFTGYKSFERNLWMRSDSMKFYDLKLGDNQRATFFAYNQEIIDSLIVGRSANVGNPVTAAEVADGRSLPLDGSHMGHGVYDGPSGAIGIHFAGFYNSKDAAFQTNGAAQKSTVHYARGLTWGGDVSEARKVNFRPASYKSYMWSSGLIDQDGTLTGVAGTLLTPKIVPDPGHSTWSMDNRFNRMPDSTLRGDWGAYLTRGTDFGLMRVDPAWANGSAELVKITRSDGTAVHDDGTYNWYYQDPVALNKDLTYKYEFPKLPNDVRFNLLFAEASDVVYAEVPGLPTAITITGATGTSSLALMRAYNGNAHYRDPATGSVFFKFRASGFGDKQYGDANSAKAQVRIQLNGLPATGRSTPFAWTPTNGTPITLYNGASGVGRASLARPNTSITHGPLAADAATSSVTWDVTSNGDAAGSYVDFHANFAAPVNLSNHATLRLKLSAAVIGAATAPRVQIFLHDVGGGYTDLGKHALSSLATGELLLLIPKGDLSKIDQVDDILIRVNEADMGPLTTANIKCKLNLYAILVEP